MAVGATITDSPSISAPRCERPSTQVFGHSASSFVGDIQLSAIRPASQKAPIARTDLQDRLGGSVAGAQQDHGGLKRTLIEHDLVDEVRLFVFPVVVGAGERLFGETSDKTPLRLVDTKTVGDGPVFVTYEVVRRRRVTGRSGRRSALGRRRVYGWYPLVYWSASKPALTRWTRSRARRAR